MSRKQNGVVEWRRLLWRRVACVRNERRVALAVRPVRARTNDRLENTKGGGGGCVELFKRYRRIVGTNVGGKPRESILDGTTIHDGKRIARPTRTSCEIALKRIARTNRVCSATETKKADDGFGGTSRYRRGLPAVYSVSECDERRGGGER